MKNNKFFALLFLALFLQACTETELAAHMAKRIPNGQPQNEGLFKVGNPYKVDGTWYEPTETYSFTETGIASWYGPGFQGHKTANGEVFDMNELTGAHRTLQMPSLVRVTNLENGRSLIVRINDRGPFKRGRVIDLSKRAADLLGFRGTGTAKVKLQLLSEESRAIADAARRGQDTRGVEVAMNEKRLVLDNQTAPAQPAPVQTAAYQPVQAQNIQGHMEEGRFLPDPVVKQFPVSPTNIYVQAGSFTQSENASRLAESLGEFGRTQVVPAQVSGRQFYRVRLGPIPSVDQADTLLGRLASGGHKEAIIVVD